MKNPRMIGLLTGAWIVALVGGCSSSETGGGQAQGGAGGTSATGGSGGASCPVLTELCNAEARVVDDDWLASQLDDMALELVDVRPWAAYETSRIPGATHVDVNALRAVVDGIAGQVAPVEVVNDVLGAAGLVPGAPTVVYGATTDTTPARLVWTLQVHGHDNVRLLDGGWTSWTQAGRTLETVTAAIEPSSYVSPGLVEPLRVDADWIAARLDDPTVVLVDARTASEHAAGHIPGALNVDWHDNVEGAVLKPRDQVAALYGSIDPGATVVAYCQTGSRASVSYVVLQWLGFADVRLYDGSWADWETRSDLPVETS